MHVCCGDLQSSLINRISDIKCNYITCGGTEVNFASNSSFDIVNGPPIEVFEPVTQS